MHGAVATGSSPSYAPAHAPGLADSAAISIKLGTAYNACPPGVVGDAVCEPGAAATDGKGNDITEDVSSRLVR